MAEGGCIEVAQLGEREGRRGQCETDVGVRELPAQPLTAGEDDLVVVEGELRQAVDGLPGGVLWQLGVDAGGDDAEERGRELPARGVAARLAPRAELLEMRELPDVDLRREVAPDRGLERLVRFERPAGERPRARVGLARALPQQRLQPSLAHLEHDRERDLARWCGRISARFVPHSLKPNGKALPMRRLLPLALLLSLVVLAGCGGSDDEAGQTTTTTATSEENPIRVGLITDQGQLDDNGFNELAFRGLERAEKELGIKGRVVESASAADYIPNMTRLARDGYDLVIGVGFAQGDAIGKVAQKFPDVGFAIIDVDQAFVPGKARERSGAALPRGGGRLPRRLPRRARGEAARGRGCDQRRRRDEGAAGRPVRGRLLRRCRRRLTPGSRRCSTTHRTGTTRRSARSSR